VTTPPRIRARPGPASRCAAASSASPAVERLELVVIAAIGEPELLVVERSTSSSSSGGGGAAGAQLGGFSN